MDARIQCSSALTSTALAVVQIRNSSFAVIELHQAVQMASGNLRLAR